MIQAQEVGDRDGVALRLIRHSSDCMCMFIFASVYTKHMNVHIGDCKLFHFVSVSIYTHTQKGTAQVRRVARLHDQIHINRHIQVRHSRALEETFLPSENRHNR